MRPSFARHCLGLTFLSLAAVLPAARGYVLEGYQWPNDQPIVMDVQLGTPGHTLIDQSSSWNQVAEDALEIWNLYLGDQVQFAVNNNVITPSQGDGINSVFFNDTVYGESFGNDTLAVTLSFYNNSTKIKTEADVIFNRLVTYNSYRGPLRPDDGYDLRRVALHEFGHVLGLEHTSQDSQSIMTPVITDIDSLQPDDIAGAEAIYGNPTPDAPAISSALNAATVVDQPFTYQITATRTPPTSYQADGLPPGLSIDSVTGMISGLPTQAGSYLITLGASNVAGTGTAILTLLVVPVPAVTSNSIATTIVNTPFRYQITASGGVTSYAMPYLPAGLTLNSSTGLISGTPTAAGSYYLEIKLANVVATAIGHLSLTVANDGALTILHGYNPAGGLSSLDVTSLIQGGDGNFYGTSRGGYGYIFQYAPDGTATTLFNFPAGRFAYPGSLVRNGDGSFYCTAAGDGVHDYGSICKIDPGGVLTTVYQFPLSANYASISATLLQGSDGNIYGTLRFNNLLTLFNGYQGAVFKLAPDGTFAILHSFNGVDGFNPNGLIQAADGNFYGTTSQGGSGGRGTIFEVTADGVFTILHQFGSNESGYPSASLVQGSDGSFYGGAYYGEASGGSTIFKVDPVGNFTTLHVFVGKRGEAPSNALVQGIDGNFYGMTGFSQVDSGSSGTIYKMTPDGELTVLHQFVLSEGRGGSLPMMPDATGYLYGLSDSAFFRVGTFSVAASASNLPTVTLAATTPQVLVNSGAAGVFTIDLSEAQSTDVIINYTVKGTALDGTDYLTLKGTKKIKAGKTSELIKIKPLGDLGGVSKKTVKLTLAPGVGYTVGTTGKVKIEIVAP